MNDPIQKAMTELKAAMPLSREEERKRVRQALAGHRLKAALVDPDPMVRRLARTMRRELRALL